MFDMKKNSGSNEGYKLAIHYNKKMDLYFLTGFTVFMDHNNRIYTDQDGAALTFKSLEEVLNHISNYKK